MGNYSLQLKNVRLSQGSAPEPVRQPDPRLPFLRTGGECRKCTVSTLKASSAGGDAYTALLMPQIGNRQSTDKPLIAQGCAEVVGGRTE